MKIIFFLIFPYFSFAQGRNIEGYVVNSRTKEKIPFASITLLKKNFGVNADENGYFFIHSENLVFDTVEISCVGYFPLKFAINNFPSESQFELIEEQKQLSEIEIKKRPLQNSVNLNEFSTCGINYYTCSNAISQVAQRLEAPTENSILSDIYLCKLRENSIFRIRVYNADSTLKMPDKEITDTTIEIRSTSRHVHVDMSSYHIYLKNKFFFVAIEWLKTDSNKKIEKAYFNGVKTSYLQYSPSISYREKKGNSIDDPEVWQKTYAGKWIKFYPINGRLLISVVLKY